VVAGADLKILPRLILARDGAVVTKEHGLAVAGLEAGLGGGFLQGQVVGAPGMARDVVRPGHAGALGNPPGAFFVGHGQLTA